MVLPIQWRKKLNLRTDHGIETITQPSMPGVFKNITNLTVDLLWYFTPEFRQAIVDVLTDELNKTVNKIRQFFPKFDGKISIVGHSLGSILMWDILAHQTRGKVTELQVL